jgi:exosortase
MSFHVFIGLLLVGFPIVLFWHVVRMLQTPHFQYVPLLPVLMFLLMPGRDLRVASDDHNPRQLSGAAAALLTLGAGLLLAASWFWSPWLGVAAVLPTAAGALWQLGGRKALHNWSPLLVMATVLIPPPFGLDRQLTLWLKNITTAMTSDVLDAAGVLHQHYLNVIELPGKALYVADACSGVQSFFVLLAGSVFWAIFARRGIVHGGLLVASSLAVVVVENVARICCVAVAWRLGHDLSSGTPHLALGFVLFVFSLFLIWSIDQLLVFLLSMSRPDDEHVGGSDTIWPTLPEGTLPVAVVLLAMVFPVAGVIQATRMPWRLPRMEEFVGYTLELPDFELEGLPEFELGWQRGGYKTIKRVADDLFGMNSQQWTYARSDVVAQLSLDYPFGDMHDLRLCYRQTGWTIEDSRLLTVQNLQELGITDPGGPISVVYMVRPLDGRVLLLFSDIDRNGQFVARMKGREGELGAMTLMQRLLSFRGQGADVAPEEPNPVKYPLLQWQALVRSAGRLTDADEKNAVRLYAALRKRIAAAATSGPSPVQPAVANEKSDVEKGP